MTPTLFYAMARKAEGITPDADLLLRFARDRDHPAFEELVRRHGPLVWAVCRHMLPDHADAEDAFQAVFLALARSATTIRDGRAVPAWLHGVAVRVATRARREFARRRRRERSAALPEADRPVADAAWESLVAAVHEEVQRLPDAERTAFVLCDLEGVSQPDAAARLGWPLGSLSGRLCKARQRLMERLSARGVAPATAIGIGLTAGVANAIPANLLGVVTMFPGSPGAASGAATALARGLTEGLTMRVKLMVAATVVVVALGLTGGAALLSKADAQPPGPGGAGLPPSTGGFAPQPGGLPPAGGAPGAPPGGVGGPPPAGGPVGAPPPGAGGAGGGFSWATSAATWEYKFVDLKNDRKEFERIVTQHGKEGWEFCGSERFDAGPTGKPGELTLVFKKSKGGAFGGGTGGSGGGRGGSGGGIGAPPAPGGGGTNPGPGTNFGPMPGGLTGAGAKPAASLNVFTLKNAKADEMLAVLKQLFPNADMTADPRTNTVIVRGDEKTLDEVKALITRLESLESSKPK